MHVSEAGSSATPEQAWCLIAEPARWSTWAPHIRGAVGLGSPEVEAGRRGVVIVAFVAPVPVVVTAKEPGRSWSWRAGPVRFRHSVIPRPGGCVIRMELDAPGVIERAIVPVYGPVIAAVTRRLARIAAEYPRGSPQGSPRADRRGGARRGSPQGSPRA